MYASTEDSTLLQTLKVYKAFKEIFIKNVGKKTNWMQNSYLLILEKQFLIYPLTSAMLVCYVCVCIFNQYK